MPLVRYEPWNLVSQLQEELNRVFNSYSTDDSSSVTAEWVPAVDIEEYKDRFELHVDLPGIDPDSVEITLDNGVLSLAGERQKVIGKDDSQPVRVRNERGQGKFYRRFILPDTVDTDSVNATGHNGVLEISIPKQAKAQPRKIKVAA